MPSPPPGPDDNPLPDPLGVTSGILVDPANGTVLWSVNENEPRPPASLTKILTALVVLDRANLGDTVTITQEDYQTDGANTYALPGWTYSVEDLLWGLLLVSGNDMAIALAHAASPDGTVAGFVRLMNADAASLGATSTQMANPHGLDAPGHVSTARDLALLTMVAMRNPTFATMVGTSRHNFPWDGGVHTHLLVNHNKLLTQFPGTIGVKTGYTNDSGNSLASEVTRDGHTLLAVVLDAKSPAGYNDSMAVYNWGFANFDVLEARSGETIVPGSLPPHPAPAAAPAGAGRQAAGHAVAPGVAAAADTDVHPVSDHRGWVNLLLMCLLAASIVAAWWLSSRWGPAEGF